MPVNTSIAAEVWLRYQHIRDNGHLDYVLKAMKCEDFFAGLQWTSEDLALLKQSRRPALTINKILSTISNVMGEQIYNRTEIGFRPRDSQASEELADVLTKVFMQISDNNQLPWVRSDVFADGIITSRGFYDLRLDFSDSLRGEARISQLNPKNVLIDMDADEYDPDHWGDVIVTKWMTPDMIELLYSKDDAELLRGRMESFFPYGYDSVDRDRDRFGTPRGVTYGWAGDLTANVVRNIRVIERQWKKLDKREHFVDTSTGDMRPLEENMDREKIGLILQQNPNLTITKKLVQRIRWTVVADAVVLHDDWSPYEHFTVVPFFPYFRRGRTVGLVENLLGPQELLNKVSSQELHVVNTTANSGWKLKRNALQNMSVAELEQRGAQTGIVLELDEIDNAEKIQPNATPQGLDRISFKAEDHIKTISGVSDYQQGNPREDVSAKAIQQNRASGAGNMAKVMDNLSRTDHLLARNILDCVQKYYTEERLMHITQDRITGQTQPMTVNQVTPEGKILNDLTIGEYEVVVTSQPERDTFEDTQFDQAVSLRKDVGVQIPDSVIIQASRLKDKAKIVQDMQAEAQSPEAQQMKQLEMRGKAAEVSKIEAEAQSKSTDSRLKAAKARHEMIKAQAAGSAPDEQNAEMFKIQQEIQLEREKADAELQLEQQKMEKEFELKRQQMDKEFALKQDQMVREHALKSRQAQQDHNLKRAQALHEGAKENVSSKSQAA